MSFSERSDIAANVDELERALAARRVEGREVLDLTVAAPATRRQSGRASPLVEKRSDVRSPSPREGLGEGLQDASDPLPPPLPEGGGPSPCSSRGSRGEPERIIEALKSVGPRASLPADLVEGAIAFNGRREALRSALRLLCDPADEVLGPEPAPPWLAAVAHAEDIGLVSYPLVREERWSIDAAALYDAITPRTRAIVVTSPNAPTGAYPSGDELEALASFGLPLIADEVDFDLTLEAPSERVRAMTVRADGLVVTLGARLELPVMPLAWLHLHGPRTLTHEAFERLEAMRGALDPLAPPIDGLWPLRDVAREAIQTRAARNLAALRAALGDRLPRVEGGAYAPIAMPPTQTDLAWARWALERGVLVHPGSRFGLDERDAWLIVGLLSPPEVFDAGVAVLARR